jgi:hypothetical protein
VLDSNSLYCLATGATLLRDGLRAFQLRVPAPARSGPVGKVEWARQTSANFDMSAIGAAVDGGWSFGQTKWPPTSRTG